MLRRNKLIYYIINAVFIVLALFFIKYETLPDIRLLLPDIIIILLLFILIHVARFIRMYFILLEDLIRPSRFFQLYVKTTFVSTLIPFKIGEFFKMYCYSVETGSARKGVTAVVIEKYFDALVLCFFIVPYTMKNSIINPLVVILSIFILMASILYFSFNGTYGYLNKFLICRGGGRKSLIALKILEEFKKIYDGIKRTLKGRFILLLFLSLVAWTIEGVLIMIINTGINFNYETMLSYISDGFFGVTNASFNYYACLCAGVFFLIMVGIYGRKYFSIMKNRRRNKI